MPSRHKSRERALQILFQLDLRPEPVEDAMADYYGSLSEGEGEAPAEPDPFAETLVRGTMASRREIDERIQRHSEHWRLERMPAVDRNILRMAIFELTELREPPAVVINEALVLARRYSGDESAPFINGVLDAVRKEMARGAVG